MTGYLVISRAGHDKGKLYLAVRQDADMLWLSDGDTRDLAHPKKKNPRHVQRAERLFEAEEIRAFDQNPAAANQLIRRALAGAEKRRKQEGRF